MPTELFSVPVAAIIARELLEASVIIGQFRLNVQRSDHWDEGQRAAALRAIWLWAGVAAALALLVSLAVAVPLAALGGELDEAAAEIIEGVSKIVAALCILQLSLKIPKWFSVGPYSKVGSKETPQATHRELCFNVAWNIWREMAEIGVFLIPFFLAGDLAALPLSAVVGILVGLSLGGALYVVLRRTTRRLVLATAMAVLTGWLACGLFTGGLHEFEEVLGETPDVFHFPGCESSKSPSCAFWSHKKFPCALFKPFGYSHSPSVLQMVAFWGFTALLLLAHAAAYRLAQRRVGSTAKGEAVIHAGEVSQEVSGTGGLEKV